MKYITSISLFWFCIIFIAKNASNRVGVPTFEITPASPDMCICYAYYFNNLKERHRTTWQTCDPEILDYREDKTIELFTVNVPCDSLFEGTKILK